MQACPNCKVVVQKNGGCPHMDCSSCSFSYCWLCQHGTNGKWDELAHRTPLSLLLCPSMALFSNSCPAWAGAAWVRWSCRVLAVGVVLPVGLGLTAVALAVAVPVVPTALGVRRVRDARRERARLHYIAEQGLRHEPSRDHAQALDIVEQAVSVVELDFDLFERSGGRGTDEAELAVAQLELSRLRADQADRGREIHTLKERVRLEKAVRRCQERWRMKLRRRAEAEEPESGSGLALY